MSRSRKLEVTAPVFAVAGTTLTVSLGPATLIDGKFYQLHLSTELMLPTTLTGNENVMFSINGTPIAVSTKRSRLLRSRQIVPGATYALEYVADSILSTTTAVPVFVVIRGLVRR